MSRAYRVAVSESENRVVRAEDKVSTHLELLEVLPCEQLATILTTELEKQGFKEKDGKMIRKDQEVDIAVDPKSGEVTVSTQDSKKVAVSSDKEGRAYDDDGSNAASVKAVLTKEAKKDLDAQEAAKQKELQGKVTDRLERHLTDIRGELDQVVNRTTAAALKQKAAQMGQIKEITEDAEGGSLTIVVEV